MWSISEPLSLIYSSSMLSKNSLISFITIFMAHSALTFSLLMVFMVSSISILSSSIIMCASIMLICSLPLPSFKSLSLIFRSWSFDSWTAFLNRFISS